MNERHEPGSPRVAGAAGGLLALVNGVLAGIGGVYLATRSVTVTVVAGGVALVLAVLVLARKQ